MHALRRLFAASLLGFFFTSTLIGASLSGLVLSSSTSNPMANAAVSIPQLGRETSTDRSGRYRFINLPAGNHVVSVRYLGYEGAVETVAVSEAGEARADFQIGMAEDVINMEDFVVEGIREGQARALQQKRMAAGIMDAVSADAVGKFPDGNAAEALRRMPGVSVEIDQDEGRYVVIRGIDSALNNVTLNNQILGTPSEQGNRGVAMDSVPADLIARLEVVKAVTPDMDATAIGGSVNIVTQSAFERPEGFLYGSVSGFYDEFRGRLRPNGSLTVGRLLGAEKKWGLVAGASYSLKDFGSQTSDAGGWQEENGFWVPDEVSSFDYNIERERIGVNLALQFRPGPEHELTLRLNHNELTDIEGRQNSDFNFGRGDLTEQTATSGVFSEGRATREFRDYHQTATIDALSLEGKHVIASDYELSWQVGTSSGERDVPIRNDWEFRSSGSAFPNSYSISGDVAIVAPSENFYDPDSYPFRRIRLRHDLEQEDIFSAQVDLKRDAQFGSLNGYWKTGVKYVTRDKADDRENTNYSGDGPDFTLGEPGLAGPEPENFLQGRYRYGPTIDLAAMEAFFKANPDRFEFDELGSLDNSLASDFEGSEDVLAAYAMASVDLNSEWKLLAGVRVENTQADYAANELILDDGDFLGEFNRVSGSNDYTDFMPGLHLAWRPNEKVVVRFAWTNTLGRPNYADLAPRREFDQIEEPEGSGIWEGSISDGNPGLKPYRSMNWDASVEYYFQNAGVVSAGLFHKSIENPVYGSSFTERDVTVDGRFYSILGTSRPENAESGKITGLELNYQQFFTFLPSPFDGLGVNLNYTITDSSATLLTQGGRELTFFKQADTIGNFALVYEKYGFEARVAVAWTGPYLDGVGSNADMDVYVEDRKVLDAKLSYRLNETVTLFGEFLNVYEEPLVEYTGNNSRYSGYEIYAWKAKFGLNFSL